VLNPRDRNTKAFKVIVGNIKDIGLKKPIKVTPRTTDAGEQRYVLVFGEGRLTAFRNLGEKEIPAIVVEISDEDAFLMSLVENIARRQENRWRIWPASPPCAPRDIPPRRSPPRSA
jgi:ParB family chromosome partitioning protein